MKTSKIMMGLLALMVVVACSKMPWRGTAAKDDWRRGNRWDYDAGAPKDSKWPDLFAETPNYRAFGKAVIGGSGEKFRWKMGPMWYRGRLEPNKVKIFIIGQEGAQDENVLNH
jgi:hypothetical protein